MNKYKTLTSYLLCVLLVVCSIIISLLIFYCGFRLGIELVTNNDPWPDGFSTAVDLSIISLVLLVFLIIFAIIYLKKLTLKHKISVCIILITLLTLFYPYLIYDIGGGLTGTAREISPCSLVFCYPAIDLGLNYND